MKEKLWKFMMVLCLACCFNITVLAQQVTFTVKDVTVKAAVIKFKKATGYSFVFGSSKVNTQKKISINANNQPLKDVVDQILVGQNVNYEIDGKFIIVKNKQQIDQKIVNSQRANSNSSEIKVKGKLTDEKSEPIIGATVSVQGFQGGTVTDTNGEYTITVNPNAILKFDYIGYKSQFVPIKGRQIVNATMRASEENLNEIVVVGYGTQKKANLSGSVAQLDGKVLEDRPITNVSAGLQGLMPGITVTGTGGAPGQDTGSMHVRGVGTLNTSTPYILVDGVETGNLSSLDPDDIESISVLKDASSAAIYGSKASNGVILVTTKRGSSGKPTVSYSGYFGIQDATSLVDRMSSADYAYYYNQALARSNKPARFTDEEIQKFRDGSDPKNYPNTNWADLAYKTGFENRHNVNVTGGNEYSKYMASVGYLKQTGILPNAGREQFNARTNLDMNISKSITAHLNLSFIQNNYSDASSAYAGGSSDQLIRQLNIVAPWIVGRYDDGTYGTTADGNPLAWLDSGMKVQRDNRNITNMLGIDWQIYKDLKLTLQGAYVDNTQRYNYFQKFIQYNSSKSTEPNHLEVSNTDWHRTNFDAYLNYSKSLGQHNFKVMGGWHTERYKYLYDYMYRKNFPNNDLNDMNAGDASTQQNSGYSRELTMVSGFGRFNYDYAGRYLFEANFRADASSRFAEGHRWGYFPSFSAAWRISEEKFMKGTSGWLDNLKLRASWGELGNQDALSDYYPALNTYNLDATYPFGGSLSSGYYQSSYHLSTISWEKSTTWGIGIDFGLFKGLTGSFDYYNRKTSGIIMDVAVPAEFALSAYKDNIGSMRNTGIEMQLDYFKQLNKDWSVTGSFNLAYNKNKILDLGEGVSYMNSDDNHRNAVGHQFQEFYMYKANGFFNSQKEADAYAAKYGNPFGMAYKAGDIRIADANGDGVINSDDRIYTGRSDMPKITYGFTVGVTWKDFDLSTVWQGVDKVSHIFNQEVLGEFKGDTGHPSTLWKNSWTEDDHNARMPRIYEPGTSVSDPSSVMSTFWLWNSAYLRLKTLQVGYTFPKRWLNAIGIRKIRLYYAGENLLTFDHLPFNSDPEITSDRGSSYPLLRTHSFGINIIF